MTPDKKKLVEEHYTSSQLLELIKASLSDVHHYLNQKDLIIMINLYFERMQDKVENDLEKLSFHVIWDYLKKNYPTLLNAMVGQLPNVEPAPRQPNYNDDEGGRFELNHEACITYCLEEFFKTDQQIGEYEGGFMTWLKARNLTRPVKNDM